MPFHSLLHQHKIIKVELTLQIKKHEVPCCATSDALPLQAYFQSLPIFGFQIYLSDILENKELHFIQVLHRFFDNKAPPVSIA